MMTGENLWLWLLKTRHSLLQNQKNTKPFFFEAVMIKRMQFLILQEKEDDAKQEYRQ